MTNTETNNIYYTMLATEAKEKFTKLAEDKASLTKQIAQAKKKLEDEKSRFVRIKMQIDKLNSLCGESLAAQNDYESYKVALRKRNTEQQTLQEVITTLEKTVLPSLREKFTLANKALSDGLKIWTREKVKICQDAITEKFQKHILDEEYDDFKDCMTHIWKDYGGATYPVGRTDTSPSLIHPRLAPPSHIKDLSVETRIERLKNIKK